MTSCELRENDACLSLNLAGAHTIGRAQCQTIQDRLYNFSGTGQADPTTLDPAYLAALRRRCPAAAAGGDGTGLNDLDPATPDTFEIGRAHV